MRSVERLPGYGERVIWRPEDLSDLEVVDAVDLRWAIRADHVEYAPVGFGSYHWWVSAGGRRWFVTADDLDSRRRSVSETTDQSRARLRAALTTARCLCDVGLDFVVAPLRSAAGDVIEPVGGRYALAVYPEVAGEVHEWGAYPDRTARLAVIERLVAVHGERLAPSPAFVDDLSIAKRDELVAGLANIDVRWDTGPFGEPARQLFGRHADAIARVLDRYDRLATNVRQRHERMVVTHGEPHRGNTITTTAGVVLIDWDTALMAPPERDLWSLAGEDAEVLDAYTARTGTAIDPEAIELYRLSWDLSEIAICSGRFLREHTDQEDVRTDWTVLQRYLDPARWS